MLRQLVKFQIAVQSKLDSERGATAVEYGLMVALIAVFIIGAVRVLGTSLDGLFRSVGATITATF